MDTTKKITNPDDPALDTLCTTLAEMADSLEPESSTAENWPAEQLKLTDEYGVSGWFVPTELGGLGWSASQILAGYLKLTAACLTTTFIITQRAAAIRRIVATENVALRDELLGGILAGDAAATVGISHLTTSRRHLDKPVLRATKTRVFREVEAPAETMNEATDEAMFRQEPQRPGSRSTDWVLDGYSPWVTGACSASHLVVGAELDDGRQVLLAVPRSLAGVVIESGFSLVALSGSQTGAVRFNNVAVPEKYLLAGPVAEVLKTGTMGATGGSQTSGLAIGLAGAAIKFLQTESERRPELVEKYEELHRQWNQAREHLLAATGESPSSTSNVNPAQQANPSGSGEVELLRIEANSLVLRATQAALVAAKGAGYVTGHPVGRWCREALFFLVWSCPPNVANANLCELVGPRT